LPPVGKSRTVLSRTKDLAAASVRTNRFEKEVDVKLRPATAATTLLALVLASPLAGQAKQAGDDARKKATVATQKRINHYFHDAVFPKLKPCWDRLAGKGSIEIKYLYTDNGKGGWGLKTIPGRKSDLAKGPEDAAVSCMQKAVAGTSFPRESGEKGKSFLVSWVWPVPLPPDAEQQMARMWGSSGGEGGGCDGHGASARCVTCSGSPLSCVYVCVGSDSCEVQATKPGGFDSICSEGGKCASGGLFGLVVTVAIY